MRQHARSSKSIPPNVVFAVDKREVAWGSETLARKHIFDACGFTVAELLMVCERSGVDPAKARLADHVFLVAPPCYGLRCHAEMCEREIDSDRSCDE